MTSQSPTTPAAGKHWRTLKRLPWLDPLPDGSYRLQIEVAKERGAKRVRWKKVSSTEFKPGGWATEAAALAARPAFKRWVDYEMN
eukprot:723885-Prymnesium_polylepis.1